MITPQMIRYVDAGNSSTNPPQEFQLVVGENEKIISIETVTDAFGFAVARIWIAKDFG